MSDHWKNEFENAKVNSSSEYMKPGNFLLRIDAIKEGKNRKNVGNFKLEGTIVHKFDGEQNVGTSVCDMYSEKSEYFFSEVKAMLSGLTGTPASDITYDHLLSAAGESQPFRGIVVEYSAWNKETKSGGNFTQKKCKGMKTKSEWLNVALPENVERFQDLRFKKEPEA